MENRINILTTDNIEVDINPTSIEAVEDGPAPNTCIIYLKSGTRFKACLSRPEFNKFLILLYDNINGDRSDHNKHGNMYYARGFKNG